MVAITEEVQAQAKTTPAIALPLASKAAAVNCCVPPTAMVAGDGETVMDAIDCVTVRVDAALVTVVFVAPGAEAVI
jgi:hypothetical protein